MDTHVTHLGEAAALVQCGDHVAARELASIIRRQAWPGVEDVVPAAESVAVLVDPEATPADELVDRVSSVLEHAAGAGERPPAVVAARRKVDVEICFDGPDLERVADLAGIATTAVIAALESARLEVGWLGFMPGFPYIVGLPPSLQGVPRLGSPRERVTAGAFAIAGGYAGIYPSPTPGGWNVLGRTALELFDDTAPDPAALAPGDLVRCHRVESLEERVPTERPPIRTASRRRCAMLEPGVLTTVQDYARLGVAHLGVPRAGPADPLIHAIANAAVGNPARAAALEITAAGPTIRFDCETFAALAGDADLVIDGRLMPAGSVETVLAGQTVTVGRVRDGARAYLAVAGGFGLEHRFGSCSADTSSGLWPGPLRHGDELEVGNPGRPRGRFLIPRPVRPVTLRLLATPGGGTGDAELRALLEREWRVTAATDRAGTRFEPSDGRGPSVFAPIGSGTLPSRPTVTGSVQLPPHGDPIVLGPDHGTVGGYPTLGVLTSDSLGSLGQLLPGDLARFDVVELAAREPLAEVAEHFVSGWLTDGHALA